MPISTAIEKMNQPLTDIDTYLARLEKRVQFERETVMVIGIGGSPAVLTETVYGIMLSDTLAMPSTIVVLTTLHGYSRLEQACFFDEGSPLLALIDEYELPDITFSKEHVHVVHDEEGNPLHDIRSVDENRYMADMITDVIKGLTQETASTLRINITHEMCHSPQAYAELTRVRNGLDDRPINGQQAKDYLHPKIFEFFESKKRDKIGNYRFGKKRQNFFIEYTPSRYSILMSTSGGRKTMTFLSGYIMTLMARDYDIMSHVLVDELAIGAEFFFPTQRIPLMTTHRGEKFCPAGIQVTLAEIPFVRHANKLPSEIAEKGFSSLLRHYAHQPIPLLSNDDVAVLNIHYDADTLQGYTGMYALDKCTVHLRYLTTTVPLSFKSAVFILGLHRINDYLDKHEIPRNTNHCSTQFFARFCSVALLELLGVDVISDDEDEEREEDIYYGQKIYLDCDEDTLPFEAQFQEIAECAAVYHHTQPFHDSVVKEFFIEAASSASPKSCLRFQQPVFGDRFGVNTCFQRLCNELKEILSDEQAAQILPIASKQGQTNTTRGYLNITRIVDNIRINRAIS